LPALAAALLCFGLCGPAVRAADQRLEELEEQAFRQAAALAAPSIVRVQTVGGLDRVGQVLTGTGPTTGIVVSPDGFIVSSAFNFASKPTSILVQLSDGRRFPATQVATDRSKMLTLMKIEATDLVPLPAADAQTVRVGQWAIALGKTFDVEQPSVSVGIVSALNRIWGRALQTDAKVSPVNYGGPLVDVEGKALGVLVPLAQGEKDETAGVEWYDSGIGFAIPMPDVLASVERLKAGKDLHPGLMGVTMKHGPLDAAAEIDRIRPRSPAAEAGLKAGDVIVEMEGKPVRRHSDVQLVLGRKYADETVALVVARGKEKLNFEIKLVAELTAYEPAFLGILPVRPATTDSAAQGVAVRYVFSGSPAERAGLRIGDRILKFNGGDLANATALGDLVGRLKPEDKAAVVYSREGQQTSVEIALATTPNDVPEKLPTAATEPVAADKAAGRPQTGRFTVNMPAQAHGYWAYVPDDYNPAQQYGLMIWLHPAGDTMEAAIINEWKSICDTRGMMIVAPKAEKISGWELNEGEFVKDAFDDFCQKYSVDRSRVFLHSSSTSGPFAYLLAFRYRDRIRGVAMAAAPLRAIPPENDPEHPLQFHLVCGDQDQMYSVVEQTVDLLRGLKFPTSFTTVQGGDDRYPPNEQVEEIGRWADCLDRI
jgi:serine protease Do